MIPPANCKRIGGVNGKWVESDKTQDLLPSYTVDRPILQGLAVT